MRRCTIIIRVTEELLKSVFVKQCHHVGRWEGILSDKYSRDPSQLIVSDKYSRDPSQLIFSDKYSTTETLIEGFGFKLSWLHTNV